MNRHSLVLLIGAILLAACAPSQTLVPPQPPPATVPATEAPTVEPTQGPLPHVDWLAYHDDLGGFSIEHPLTWQQREGAGYPVVFALPGTPGTNLIEKTMEINVTQGVTDCKESLYNTQNAATPPEHVTINGVDFLKEFGGGIAAGNIYDTTSYSTLKGTTCITVTFVLHSSSSGVYSTEPAPYDKALESEVFDDLINTFRFDQ